MQLCRPGAAVIMLGLALGVGVTGCARSASSPAVTVTQTVAPTSSSSPDLGSVRDQLRAVGANAAAVRALAVVARTSGYLRTSRAFTDEEADNFAYMALLECQDVASGEKTWEQSLDEAVRDGASSADATRMTAYLRSTFCPLVAGTEP